MAEPVEGAVVRSEDGVTVGQLALALADLIRGNPELYHVKVAVATHCCVEDLRAEDPEVREEGLGLQSPGEARRYLVLHAGG